MSEIHAIASPPDEVEVEFGLKATAELGNFAIGKVNGETNYTVRLKWTKNAQTVKGPAESSSLPRASE